MTLHGKGEWIHNPVHRSSFALSTAEQYNNEGRWTKCARCCNFPMVVLTCIGLNVKSPTVVPLPVPMASVLVVVVVVVVPAVRIIFQALIVLVWCGWFW